MIMKSEKNNANEDDPYVITIEKNNKHVITNKHLVSQVEILHPASCRSEDSVNADLM